MATIKIERGRLCLRAAYEDNAKASGIPGARWNPIAKCWHWPASPGFYARLIQSFPLAEVDSECNDLIEELDCRYVAREADRAESWKKDHPIFPQWKTQPWEHQRRAVLFAAGVNAALLDCHMGTGKTKIALDTCAARKHKRILILCPKAVIPVWKAQAERHFPGSYQIAAEVKGSTQRRADKARAILAMGKTTFVVFNYEAMLSNAVSALALDGEWDCLILDEAHRIKAPGGKASQKVAKIKAKQKIALTGTPLPHSPLDAYGLYRALDPGIFGTSFRAFRDQYAVMGGFENRQAVAFKNQDDLAARMDTIRLRIENDVLDLPELVPAIDRMIDLGPESLRAYREMENLFITEVEGEAVTASNALAKMLRLQQITSGYLPNSEGGAVQIGSDKAAALADLFEDLGKEPVVVFARFRHDLDQIHKAAKDCGRLSVELSGRRNEIGACWEDGIDTVAAVQIQAGREGIDLTRANVAVYYSLGFSLGDYQQSIARIHRPGQTRKTFIVRLIAEGTVDAKIADGLERKKEIVSHVLNAYKSL